EGAGVEPEHVAGVVGRAVAHVADEGAVRDGGGVDPAGDAPVAGDAEVDHGVLGGAAAEVAGWAGVDAGQGSVLVILEEGILDTAVEGPDHGSTAAKIIGEEASLVFPEGIVRYQSFGLFAGEVDGVSGPGTFGAGGSGE